MRLDNNICFFLEVFLKALRSEIKDQLYGIGVMSAVFNFKGTYSLWIEWIECLQIWMNGSKFIDSAFLWKR